MPRIWCTAPQAVGAGRGRPGQGLLRPARDQQDPPPHQAAGRVRGRRSGGVRRRADPLVPVRGPGRGQGRRRRPRSSPPARGAGQRGATFAKKLRNEAHGMASLLVRADLPTIDAIDAYLTAKAGTLVESMPDATDDQRRVRALLLMANPDATPETNPADLLPTVQLYLHTYSGPDSRGDRAAGGARPGHRGLDHPRPGPALPLPGHPGPRPRRPSPGGCLRDPGPT